VEIDRNDLTLNIWKLSEMPGLTESAWECRTLILESSKAINRIQPIEITLDAVNWSKAWL
jgi:hypothetical protein